MKTTVLALALLCAGPVFAQTSPSAADHAAHAAHHMDNLAILLDLTDAQKAQVQTIMQEEHAKMKASFEQAKASGTHPDMQQMHAMHEQLKQETLQRLTPVLSPAQLKKFQIIAQEMHGRHGHGHMDHSGATPPGQD